MLDSSATLSIAIYEFYSKNRISNEDNSVFKKYINSVDTWEKFLSYGIQRGEFKNVDCKEIIDIILFSYQGVRMFSTIMLIDEQIPQRVSSHIKRSLLI